MLDHLLVPLDGSSLAECVLPHAVAVARAFDSKLTLLQVLERTQGTGLTRFVDPLSWYMDATEAKAYLDNLITRLQETNLRVENTLLEGQVAERITEFVHEAGVDLVFLSSHGKSGLSAWNVSSNVLKIILRAYVPLMIVRAYQPVAEHLSDLRYRRLMVPLDCSLRAESVLPLAATLARRNEAELLLVHVVPTPQMPRREPPTQEDLELAHRVVERNEEVATKYLEQLQSRVDANVRTYLLPSSHPTATLHSLVEKENVDLVVLGAHGYSGSTRWPYGSMVLNFISYGTTPLLIVQDLSPSEVERTKAEIFARERKGH